ncbi:MAG: hypothetical protein IPK44_01280 [Candidatus Accumulibacter sp.]|uniref:hypothetical protein n=1 Tax=Accumulibacter sp. TaxID=2053492 RepID=UPI00258710B7|nr:hypothetical protein [Accumulibacter sp.]MBK8113231.1 hypothetical protein [Accumulibacter sp.]
MTLDNPGAIWPAFAVLLVIGAILDAAIRDKPGKWGSGDASAQDVARIVGGGKPKATPRDGLKLGMLWVIATILFVLFVGGK